MNYVNIKKYSNFSIKNKKIEQIFFVIVSALILYSPTLAGTSLENMYILPIIGVIFCYFISFGINRKNKYLIPSLLLFSTAALIYSINDTARYFEYIIWLLRLVALHLIAAFFFQISPRIEFSIITKTVIVYIFLSFAAYILTLTTDDAQKFIFYLFYNMAKEDENIGFMLARPGLFAGNPNALALIMCFLATPLFFEGKSAIKILALMIASFLIIVSLSRTGIAAWIATILITAMLLKKTFPVIGIIGIIVAVILAINIGALEIDAILFRFGEGLNLAGRDVIWHEVISMNRTTIDLLAGSFIYPHDITVVDSEYFNTYLRYGVLGLLIGLTICVRFLLKWTLFTKANPARAKTAGVIMSAFLIASLSASPMTSLRLSLVFVMMVCIFSGLIDHRYSK